MFIDCNRLCMDILFQESQYPGYSNYWYPQSHTAGTYGNTYPPGTEVNRQASYNPQVLQTFQAYITPFVNQIHSRLTPLHSAVPFQALSAYPNGVYNPGQYSTTMLHPSNPFYCSDQVPSRQPQYHSQTCPEQNAGGSAPPPYPVPHCQGVNSVTCKHNTRMLHFWNNGE